MKIAILGCGWLGLELGKSLKAENHEIKGSITRMERMAALHEAGIVPYSIKLFENGVQGDISSFLSGAEVLVVDIPPGLRKNPDSNFVEKIKSLIPFIEKSGLKRVIYTSSTSVYQDTEKIPEYTEESETDNSSDSSIQLRNVELLFLDNENFKTSILRFGGLIGGDRHPVKYLSGRSGIKNPEAPVNLVDREDCIAALIQIIQLKDDNGVWNVVYPEHPPKKDYYTRIAKEKNLAVPQFKESEISKGKFISSEKLIKELNFKFQKAI